MESNTSIPLCVDLDGTIIRSDLLIESFLLLIKSKPFYLFYLPLWLYKGKAYLKEQIAARVDLDASLLPYQHELIKFLKEEESAGRTLYLVTAAHESLAKKISKQLGFFKEVFATSGSTNLAGQKKLSILLKKFGEKGFDYVGNSSDDLIVWKHSRHSILVNPDIGIQKKAKKLSTIENTFEDKESFFSNFLSAIRIHQWLKNLLLFAPLLAAHITIDFFVVFKAVSAFIAFGLCASSVYILNDLLDLKSDRQHPNKRNRVFAAGKMPIKYGILLAPSLFVFSIILSLLSSPLSFLSVLLTYYALTLLYSFWARNRVIVDVLFLAILYTMRILAGSAAFQILPSFWLLAFSMFIFLSLALVKRYSEISIMKRIQGTSISGRSYIPSDLPILQSLGTASGYISVLVLALYINSREVNLLYNTPQILWLICPLLLFWISWVWIKSHRGEMTDDPVLFAIKDKVSRIVFALTATVIYTASWF